MLKSWAVPPILNYGINYILITLIWYPYLENKDISVVQFPQTPSAMAWSVADYALTWQAHMIPSAMPRAVKSSVGWRTSQSAPGADCSDVADSAPWVGMEFGVPPGQLDLPSPEGPAPPAGLCRACSQPAPHPLAPSDYAARRCTWIATFSASWGAQEQPSSSKHGHDVRLCSPPTQ